jgi:predicted lipid-binding transport protein (Tim44 family)
MVDFKNSATNNVVRTLIFVFVFCFFAVESSEARRMGGGRSFGKMPPIKRQATPPVKKTETTKPSNIQKSVSPNNAANSKRSGMMGMLGGLAAGLGLAALASYLGVGEELMGLLIFGLIALLIGVLIRKMFFKRGLSLATPSGNVSGELPSQSVTSKNSMPQRESSADSYRDLSPQEDDPEIAKFLEVAKEKFIELQSYWSSGKLEKIADFSTPELMEHLRSVHKKEKANAILSVVEL